MYRVILQRKAKKNDFFARSLIMLYAVWQKFSNIGRQHPNPAQPLEGWVISFTNQVSIVAILTLLINGLLALFWKDVVFAGCMLLGTLFFLPVWQLNARGLHRWARSWASFAMYAMVIFADAVVMDGHTETYLYCLPYVIALFALFGKENDKTEFWLHIVINTLVFIGLSSTRIGLNWAGLLPENRNVIILSARLGSMSAAVTGLLIWFTIQQRSTQTIDEKRQFYENIINAITLPIAVFDSEKRFRVVNKAFLEDENMRAQIIGKTEAEFAERTGLYRERTAYRTKMLQRCLENRQRVLFEEQYEEKGYTKTNLGVMVPFLAESGETMVVAYLTDITGMRRYEKQLLQSQKTFEAVFENATDALVLVDAESKQIENCNAAALALFGYAEKDDLRGKAINETLLAVSDELHRQVIDTVNAQGKWEGERVYMRTDGDVFVGGAAVTRFKTHDGKELTLLRITDLTAQKEAERATKEALRSAREAAETKSQFLSKISHELRTPLNAVVLLSRLMMDDKTAVNAQNIEIIYQSSNSLLEMVNEILNFSKLEKEGETLNECPADWRAVLRQAIERMSWQARRKGLSLETEISPDIPAVLSVDKLRLEQIINNLLSNAIKFTQEGYVKVMVRGQKVSDLLYRLDFEVADTGIGIPDDKKSIIFESFRQANKEIAYQFGGTGLGLAIAKQLVQMMGGNIWVEDNPQGGSIFKFHVVLQISEAQVENRQNKTMPDSEPYDLQGLPVLMAEDNAVNQFVARQIMGRWNVNLTFANNGKEALELLAKNTYKIVFMDIQMPVMDGIEAARRIRNAPPESGINSQIPIIALTADAMPETREKVKSVGMNDIVVKPFDSDSLYALIKAYLD